MLKINSKNKNADWVQITCIVLAVLCLLCLFVPTIRQTNNYSASNFSYEYFLGFEVIVGGTYNLNADTEGLVLEKMTRNSQYYWLEFVNYPDNSTGVLCAILLLAIVLFALICIAFDIYLFVKKNRKMFLVQLICGAVTTLMSLALIFAFVKLNLDTYLPPNEIGFASSFVVSFAPYLTLACGIGHCALPLVAMLSK